MKNCLKYLKIRYLLILPFLFYEFKGYGQAEASKIAVERFVQIGNHSLFASTTGSENAKFTVVFESGAGGGSQDWTKVISMLSQEVRTLCYDRAGSGRSEKGPLPQTMAQSVFELRKLIKAMKVSGHVILVGQSIGGLIVRLYTQRQGRDIAGMVLVRSNSRKQHSGKYEI